MESKEKRRRTK